MKTKILSTMCCLLIAAFLTPSVFAQKKGGNLPYFIQKEKDGQTDINAVNNTPPRLLKPWLQKPYLQTEPEKASVQDLMIAAKLWREKNVPNNIRLKDDEFTKFQRKLYQWEREGLDNEPPATAHQRMDAFVEYSQKPVSESLLDNFNVDPNWKLLGPNTNPINVPYYFEGYPDESHENSALGRINCIEFSIWDANNMWVGTASGGVWKTWDGGKNWWNITMNLPIMEISDIAIDQSNSNIVYVATGDRDGQGGWYGNGSVASRLYKTTDGGQTWNQINANFGTGTFIEGLYTHPRRTNEVVVIKANAIYKSVDGGTTWTTQTTFNAQNGFYLANANANKDNADRLYTLTRDQNYIIWLNRSDDFGQTWRRMDSITSAVNNFDFYWTSLRMSVAPSDANTVYVVSLEYDTIHQATRYGIMLRTLDGGRTWKDRGRYPSVPNTFGWFLGDSTDIDSQGDYNMVLAIDPKNRDRVFISGVDMWGSENGGLSFAKTTFWVDAAGESAHADHHWGEYSPVTGEFYLATDGGLFKTKNLTPGNLSAFANCFDFNLWNYLPLGCYQFPTKWEYAGNGISTNEFYAIDVSKSNPDMVLGGTQDNGTFMYKNGQWSGVFGGDGFVPLIHPTNPNIFYTTVYYGQMFRTTDGGQNYQYVSFGVDTLDQGAWSTPMALVTASPNTIIQARDHNVWRTTNAGNTWQPISNFPQGAVFNTTTALEVAPSTGNTIWVSRRTIQSNTSGSLRYLYKTTNGGSSWSNMWNAAFPAATITDIAIHPTNPNKVWVTFSVGYSATNVNQSKKVFYSSDGGFNWTNITEGLPPVPVWTIAISAETYDDAVYVGTGVGVFYRDSRTGRFISYQNPQMPKGIIVTDLKIHAATRRIYAGTHGHGLWRGNLYDNPQFVYGANQGVDINAFLSVYPNPSTGLVKVVWDNDKIPVESLKITDFMGRELYSDSQFKDKSVVDMSVFPRGIYMIQLKTKEETVAKKVIIEK